MGVKVAGNCMYWSQLLLPHAPTSSQSYSPVFSSHSSNKRKGGGINSCDPALTYPIVRRTDHRSPFLGNGSAKLVRTQSLESSKRRGKRGEEQSLRRAFSASLDSFTDDDEDDEEFLRRIQELAMKIEQEESEDSEILPESRNREAESSSGSQDASSSAFCSFSVANRMSPFHPCRKHEPSAEPPWPAIRPESSDWPDQYHIVPASVERRANSVDLPLSLRIIKRKKQWEEGFREAGESAYSSVKKAFSSMVFIIREVHTYTLQMREVLFYENLQGILSRVQSEMNASFVWLFEQIFSCTPTLMVYVMLLLANFTVYSVGHNSAFAAVSPNLPPQSIAAVAETHQLDNHQNSRFDPSSLKTFSVGRAASVNGNGGGGGGKVRPVGGATDDGRSDGSSSYHTRRILPEGVSTVPATVTEEGGGDESASASMVEEEATVWSMIVEEASRMQASSRDDALMDPETLQLFVSPVTVELESDDYSDYLRTELMYHQALSQDPDNSLLLSNFALFLYLVLHDHDRAEYYFKRAVGIKPADAESLSRYASFLWLARKDLEAAEETYLEAIAADPGNTYYAGNYAHFLWNTGGDDTCYPLDGDDA